MQKQKRLRATSLLAAATALAVACGPTIPTEVAIEANSRVLEEQRVTSEATGGATTPSEGNADGGTIGGAGGGTIQDPINNPGTILDPGSGPTSPAGPGDQPTSGPTEASGPVGTPGETGPIRIASVGNYSGPAGPPQAGFAESAQIWAQYINDQGGMFGSRPIELFLVDDKSDPAQHLAILKDMVENKKVHAFLLNAAALTADAGRDYLRSQNVPVVGGDCALPWYMDEGWYINHCQHVDWQFYGIFTGARQFGTKIAHFYCRESSVCSDSNDKLHRFKDEIGLEVVYEAQVLLTQPDFTTECRNAQAAGAEILFVLVDPTGVERAAASCNRQQYFPTYAQGSATVFYETKDSIKDLVVELPAFPFIGNQTPARNEFQQVMAAYKAGTPPGYANAHGWAAAKLLEKGLIEAARKYQSITPKTLLDTFHTFENETVGGLTVPLTFTPQGTRAPECWFSVLAQGGEWKLQGGGEPICR